MIPLVEERLDSEMLSCGMLHPNTSMRMKNGRLKSVEIAKIAPTNLAKRFSVCDDLYHLRFGPWGRSPPIFVGVCVEPISLP